MCPFTVTSKFLWMKYLRIAADLRKQRTLKPVKMKVHTVVVNVCVPMLCMYVSTCIL